jgi:hypothetical protein
VLPGAEQVRELEIHEFDTVFFGKGDDFVCGFRLEVLIGNFGHW